MGYVMRQGRRIEVTTLNPDPPPKARRKSFEPLFVRVPWHWAAALRRSKSARTYELALLILGEAFKDRRRTGEITLSTEVTGMSRTTKRRAAKELAKLGLINLKEEGFSALRATVLPYSIVITKN
jgi:hypothetical protein